jgi:hypothetical protein
MGPRLRGDDAELVVRIAFPFYAVLILRLVGGHSIDAAEPAVEVDIGAAPRAERLELLHCGLLADRALRDAGRSFGHTIQIVGALLMRQR